MCGLAGFNVSKAWANDNLTNERMAEVIKRGWEYNLHRGQDSAGYMRFNLQDNCLYTFRAPGSALDLIKLRSLSDVTPSSAIGIHTRSYTNGDPKDNENNHPVPFNGVWVTHNGTITNHELVKTACVEEYGHAISKVIPEVDSVAIPIVLAEHQPWQLDDIADSLADLNGGYAFHAMWEDHPSVSLLVRGRTSPLVVRYHPAIGVIYGSEDDATWQLLDAMGLIPENEELEDGWEVRKMDEYTILLVVDGVPVDYKSYKRMSWGGKTPEIVKRLLPYGDEDKQKVVSVQEQVSDWATSNNDLSLSVVDPKEVDLAYTREQGFTDLFKNKKFPTSNTDTFAKLSEADNVYKTKKSKQYHAFYGNVELVLSEHGTLRDVYHHDIIDDNDRWVIEERKPETEPTEIDEFFKKFSIPVMTPVKVNNEPMYVTRERHQTNWGNGVTRLPLAQQNRGVVGNGQYHNDFDGRGVGVTTETEDQGVVVGQVIDYDNFWKFPVNKELDDLYFLEDRICVEHGIKFTHHTYPLDCNGTKLAAFAFYSCIDEIELWTAMVTGTHLDHKYANHACERPCNYEIYHRRIVTVNDVSLSIPIGERCVRCDSKRFVKNLPSWLISDAEQSSDVLVRSNAP